MNENDLWVRSDYRKKIPNGDHYGLLGEAETLAFLKKSLGWSHAISKNLQ